MKRLAWVAWGLVLWLTAATRAEAFCGFYVAGADAELYADATMVVLMRDGQRTVVAMRNAYAGPAEDFAMVVPVPVVLGEKDVKVLPAKLFERVDALAAPRLVEYWEQDPCPKGIGLGNVGTMGHGAGTGTGKGFGSGQGRLGKSLVRVEAEFAVGEYDIVILSADDSSALETWLREHDYAIPDGAEPYLRPYVGPPRPRGAATPPAVAARRRGVPSATTVPNGAGSSRSRWEGRPGDHAGDAIVPGLHLVVDRGRCPR